MAETFIDGTTVLLYADFTTPVDTDIADLTLANFELVACLTSNAFDGTTTGVSTSGKCAGKFATSIGGEQSWTMSGEGKSVILEDGDDRISHNALFKRWRSGQPFWAAQYDPAQNTARIGVVRNDTHNDTFPDKDSATFSTSLTGIGDVYDQDDLTP